MKWKKLCMLVGLIAFLPGCAKAYRKEFLSRAKAKGWTEAEQYVALHYSYRLLFGRENPDKTYGVLYTRLSLEDFEKTLEEDIKNIGLVLGYRDPDAVKWVDAFGLREHFEKQERIYMVRRDRIQAAKLDQEFQELMGTKSSWGHTDQFGYDHSKGYDPKILLLPSPIETYAFDSAIVTDAKAKGVLQEIERYTVSHKRTLDRKEQDPLYPDDPNQFIWRARQYSLEIVKYKIKIEGEEPQDNYGNYVEGYRIHDDGKKESRPCLRAYLDGKGGYAVAVLDDDIEGGPTPGFGLPDAVERSGEGDLMSGDLVARLFPEDDRWKRVRPYEPPLTHIEIAHVGETVELWEPASDGKGWTVPISYKLTPDEDTYNVRIRMKRPKSAKEFEEFSKRKYREVEYICKEWTSGAPYEASQGAVTECFKPKDPFGKPVKSAKVLNYEDVKKVHFEFLDGTEQSGKVLPGKNTFIDERPTEVAYTLGTKRWILKDEDGDGVYEKRKETTPVVEPPVGSYPPEP